MEKKNLNCEISIILNYEYNVFHLEYTNQCLKLMANIVYISYDGLAEPLGQSQIIPYLKKLSVKNRIHIISFEKPIDIIETPKMVSLRSQLKNIGISWTSLRYHKWPSVLATLFDIIQGQIAIIKISRLMKIEIMHVRSYIPAFMALLVKRLTGAKLLFDIRGFWADERVDGGIWKRNGIVFKIVKYLERYLFRSADHIVTLTEASVSKIKNFGYWGNSNPKITVIPTCVDLDRFIPSKKLPSPNTFVFGYVGSFGTWYMLRETMDLFSAILKIRPEARMLIVNHNEHEVLKKFISQEKLPSDRIEIIKAPHEKVVNEIQRMDAASALIRPCFSKIASAPTKVAEYLSCSIPCVGNFGIGDMEKILKENRTGIILQSFETSALHKAAQEIIDLSMNSEVRKRCREIAKAHFSLSDGVEAYKSIYANLTSSNFDGVSRL